MKVLQVIHDFLPEHQAGSELYCYHLSKELQRLGHHVSLFFSEIDHNQPQYSVRGGDYDGLSYRELINNHAFSTFEETYSNPFVEKAFANYLDEIKPDVAHFHHLLNLSYGCVNECKKREIPIVFTLHDYWLTCPRGGGQRFRGEGNICHDVETNLCAECISRYSFPSSKGIRLIKRVLRFFERVEDPTLLSTMQRGRINTQQSNFISRGTCTIQNDTRQVLFTHPPSRISIRLDVFPNSSLAFAIAMDPSTYKQYGDGVLFRIACGGSVIYERFLHPKERIQDRGWHTERVDLSEFTGNKRELTFETQAQPSGNIDFCSACWAEPRIVRMEAEPYQPSLTRTVQYAGENLLTKIQRRRLKDKVDRRREKTLELFKHVDLFIAPSPFLRSKFIEYGLPEEKIVFSDYGIAPLEGLQPTRSIDYPIRFTYVGTLVEHKGLHVLIEAFNHLPREKALLNVYGSLDEFTGYVHRIQNMVAHPGINLRGRVENREITRILSETDVLVIPSIWFENSPITIHEAFLARVPVVTSRFGGMANLVEDGRNGLLFDMGDANDLYRCLIRFIDAPSLIEHMRPNPEEVKNLKEDAIWMQKIYEKLL